MAERPVAARRNGNQGTDHMPLHCHAVNGTETGVLHKSLCTCVCHQEPFCDALKPVQLPLVVQLSW